MKRTTLQAGLLTVLLLLIDASQAIPIPALSDYADGVSTDEAKEKGDQAVSSTVDNMQCLGLPDMPRWGQITVSVMSWLAIAYALLNMTRDCILPCCMDMQDVSHWCYYRPYCGLCGCGCTYKILCCFNEPPCRKLGRFCANGCTNTRRSEQDDDYDDYDQSMDGSYGGGSYGSYGGGSYGSKSMNY